MITKKFLIFLLTTMPILGLMAQDNVLDHLTVPLSNPGQPGYVEVGLMKGGVTITGYDGTEVDITSKLRSDDEKQKSPDERSRSRSRTTGEKGREGMFKIPVASSELEVEEDNNHVSIDVQAMSNTVDLEIKVPRNTSISVNTVHDGDIVIKNVNGEIEAQNVHGGISIQQVSGSVAASTTHGDIKVTMNSVDANKPMSFNTFHGDVDVTLPATIKASVKIKTVQGEVYSDFQIARTENPNRIQENDRPAAR